MNANTEDRSTPEVAELRAEARAHADAAQDSFDRSDTDGFVSQWAHGINGQLAARKADIAENGGRSNFPALFDLDGNLVAAKYLNGAYGMVWGILADDDPQSTIVAWFNPSKANNEATARANNAKKGYYVGQVRAAAHAYTGGSGRGLSGAMSVHIVVARSDKGFSRDVEIIDNGQ